MEATGMSGKGHSRTYAEIRHRQGKDRCLKLGKVWSPAKTLDLRHWDAELRTLAKRLDRDDWQAVSLAALELPAKRPGDA